MALLERSQHSFRRLALRALLDQAKAAPVIVGNGVEPEEAWRILAEAEQRDTAAVADILMYPTVGVWLARALHHTMPGRSTAWPELGYLHAVAAAAAIRCGCHHTVRVPVWHGLVSLPTVGHVRIPGSFPVGSVVVSCAGTNSVVHVNDAVTIRLDNTNPAFTPTQQHVCVSRGVTLRAWLEDTDPYNGFSAPGKPVALSESERTEWRKLLDEAWDVLTSNHAAHARELAAGLRALMPIAADVDTVGASAPSAFGGIRLSTTGSAPAFAEALIHEMQHSKLNALLTLVKLSDDDHGARYLAPWRDDPRPLVGIVHGVYAFTCGVEFWLTEAETAADTDTSGIAFAIAHRRLQIRRAIRVLTDSGHLTPPGVALVDTMSARLAVCEQTPVTPAVSRTATAMIDDHQALWRLRHARPDAAAVTALAKAWRDGHPPPAWSRDCHITPADPTRRLPSNRRNLLRARAVAPELFASAVRRPMSLPGTTPRADAALCTGDYTGAAAAYQDRLRAAPDDEQAWVGLGLALRAQRRDATALLDHPELTLAVHRRVRALGGPAPEPVALAAWLAGALIAP
jgi:HEXXH motif-containing protein